MKKLLFFLALTCTTWVGAQVLEVGTTQLLNLPSGQDLRVAALSPQGDYVLLTSGSNQGLLRYDFSTQKLSTISNQPGAGYRVAVSENGKTITFRETIIGKDKLRYHNTIQFNADNSRRRTVARKQREAAPVLATTVTIENQHIVLTKEGKTTILTPNGDKESYIWPSISPDGTRLCYYVCGVGCFVSNIDGSNPQFIARDCRAAQWYDNSVIVAMADEDDGHFTTASAIVAYNLKGARQVLTDPAIMAFYPHTAPGLVAYSTADGTVYVMQVK